METIKSKEQVKDYTRLQVGLQKRCSVQISNYMYEEFMNEYNAIFVTAKMLDFQIEVKKYMLDIRIHFENREKMEFYRMTFRRMNHGEIKEIIVEKMRDNKVPQYTCNMKYMGQFIKSLQIMRNALIGT